MTRLDRINSFLTSGENRKKFSFRGFFYFDHAAANLHTEEWHANTLQVKKDSFKLFVCIALMT